MPVTTQNPRLVGHISPSDPPVDGDHFTTGSDLTPATVTRGFIPDADGTLTVDWWGGIEGRTPATSIAITVLKGLVYPGAFIKIHSSSPSGTVLY
jgi:hypothetical protein